MLSKSLIPLGSEIIIFKSNIKTDLQQDLLTKLPMEITAKVIDYKITDGIGIGYVLITKNKLKIWIFSNELNEDSKRKYGISDFSFTQSADRKYTLIDQYAEEFELNSNHKMSYLLNPINLLKWTLYTLKDVF